MPRAGRFDWPTAGQAPGRVRATLMAVPKAWADDFAVFCRRQPEALPDEASFQWKGVSTPNGVGEID